jgi:Ca2+-binding RTX toxin-like protein
MLSYLRKRLSHCEFNGPGGVRIAARTRGGAVPHGTDPCADVEELELRRLFNGGVLVGGTLTVTGSTGADDITIYRTNNAQGDNVYAYFNTTPATTAGPFSSATVTKIIVNALAGNDTVKVEDADDISHGSTHGDSFVNEITEINGSSGVDTINGGDLADTIDGGDDGDILNGRGGNDTLIGALGNDNLDGGAGSDYMFGGLVDYSGTENGYGDDTLTGGTGADFMYGGGGNDTFTAWFDGSADYIDGGTGTDTALADNNTVVDTVLSNVENVTRG